MSLMRQHQQRVAQGQVKQSLTDKQQAIHQQQYKRWMAKLRQDVNTVKQLPDHSDRHRKGADLLDGYLPYLRDWLAAPLRHQNDVLTQCVVWAADGERWDVLFELADPAITNPKVGNLHWMKRDLGDFVFNVVFNAAKAEKDVQGKVTKTPIYQVLHRIEQGSWPLWEVNNARCYRFCGILAHDADDYKEAVRLLTLAHNLHEPIGVKGRLKAAKEQLEAQNAPQEKT